jgi:hypothetical protein
MVVHPASVFSSRWHGDSKCGRERPPIRATGEKSLREKDQAAGRRFLRPEKHRPNCAADGSLAVGSVRTYSQHQHNRRCPSFTFTYHDSPFYIYIWVLLQSWAESGEDSVSHSLMAAACGRCQAVSKTRLTITASGFGCP